VLYREVIQILSDKALQPSPKSGLERMFFAVETLGHPELEYPTIHVAGTNGKGSVSLKIAQTLEKNGYRTGLFTSPHLSCFRERIRINGSLISEEDTARLLTPILTLDLSYFEYCTLLAFQYFAEQKVDAAVIEVGLGGRLDATNLIHPVLSIITSISKDHTELLGHTEEEIAREKAGIIKPHTPVVIGPRVPRKVVEEIARPADAPLIRVSGVFPHYGEENRAIAESALSVLSKQFSIRKKWLDKEPPCRFEGVSDSIILDVAHNPDGFSQLIKRLRHTFPNERYHFLVGFSSKKDIASCAKIIADAAQSVHIIDISHPRLKNPHSLLPYFPGATVRSVEDVEHDGILVICGSFFIMGPVRKALGYEEALDPCPPLGGGSGGRPCAFP
jgi:dihydrofolate synthase/folylpolyglutamate synthase